MGRVVRGGGGGPVRNCQCGQDLGKGGLFSLVKRKLRGIQQHPAATGSSVTELVESGSAFPSVTAHKPRGSHTAACKVQLRCWETLSAKGLVQHWDRFHGEVRETLFCESSEAQSDKGTDTLTCFWQWPCFKEVWTRDLHKSLPKGLSVTLFTLERLPACCQSFQEFLDQSTW